MALEEDPPTRPVIELSPGEILNGAWRLEDLIGMGGMGRVFRAEDLKLGRKAAVKALSIRSLDDETLQRFERESRVMGKLNHPGIVTLYGVGRTRGIPWIAMRYLEGTSLSAVLKDNPVLSVEQVVPMLRQLCDALGYIHERSLLHRDLKPSNIHVGPDGRATLLDLGLARGRKSSLTRTGVVWGTPEFMSPEQITGERELDGRSDLYALAIVLYRMLSGELPFNRDEDGQLMQAHLTAPRPDISRSRPELSMSLGAALQKGMAIHPEDRYQTADEMLDALEQALAERPREGPTKVTPVRPSAPRPPMIPGPTKHVNLGTPTSPLQLEAAPRGRRTTGEQRAFSPPVPPDLDVTPKGRKITGEQRAVAPPVPDLDVTPKGRKITGEKPAVAPAPPPPKDTALSLEDDDGAPGASTQKEGFAPLPSTKREGFEPLTPSNPWPARTEDPPSVEVVRGPSSGPNTEKTPVPQPAMQQLPPYLTPPFLIGALVMTLLIGILLGKLL